MCKIHCVKVWMGCLTLFACLAVHDVRAQSSDEIKTLIEQVNQGSIKAIDQLGNKGSRAKLAVPALTSALTSDNEEMQWRAARTLGAIGPPAKAAIPALTRALQDDSTKVRAYAAYALGRMGKSAETAVDSLVKAALDRDVLVRRVCLRALRQIDAPLEKTIPIVVRVLEGADASLVMPLLDTMAEQGKDAVPRMRAALKHERACYWACIVLAEIGPDSAPAIPELKDVLKHADPDVRMQALLALGEIGQPAVAALPEIIASLEQDKFTGVQTAAAYALAKINAAGDADDEALSKLLESDDRFLQLIGAWALAKMAPQNEDRMARAVELIVAGLGSDDNHLQSAAARALVELDAPAEVVTPALVEALADDDPTVVGNSLEALASLGAKALPGIKRALRIDQLRGHAVQVVYRIGPAAAPVVPNILEAIQANKQDSLFRREAHFALAAIGPAAVGAVPVLLQALESEDIEVLSSAAYALGKLGPAADQAAGQALQKLAASDNPRTRRVAVWALLKIRPQDKQLAVRAVPLLIEALSSDNVLARIEASLALGELGQIASSAVPELKKLLTDEVPAVRQAATEALRNLE